MEAVEGRCRGLAGRVEQVRAEAERAEGQHAMRQRRLHEAQIESLKLSQILERSAQIEKELDELKVEAGRDEASFVEAKQTLQRGATEIDEARARLEAAQAGHAAAEAALAEQRVRTQQAEREAQDAIFGERECTAKIAEIENSVR